MKDTVDAVVIGTGAGGAPLMMRLAQAGMSVVALEAGRAWNPQRDFATDEVAQEPLFWLDERLSAGGDPLAFGANNSGTGLGGSTLHFTAYTPRAQDDDLHLHRDFGVAVDWPFGINELTPYYDEVERFIGVSGPDAYPWGPARGPYPMPAHQPNGAALFMERACNRMGIKTSLAPNAALTRRREGDGYGDRHMSAPTGASARRGARPAPNLPPTLHSFRQPSRRARRSGPAPSLTRLEPSRGRADHRRRLSPGRGGSSASLPVTVFLCGGGIESARLVAVERPRQFSSGQVGRNFMAHTGAQVWGVFDEEVRPNKGIPGALISEDTHRPKDANFAGGYLLQSIGVMPVTYATQVARGRGLWGEALTRHMNHYNHIAGINILGDCLPHAGNFIELSDELDGRGLAKPRIHFTNGENEKRMTAHAEKLMTRNLEDGRQAQRTSGPSRATPTSSAPAGWGTIRTKR